MGIKIIAKSIVMFCTMGIYCPGVLSLTTLMFALTRSKSSAVVARGEGCRLLCLSQVTHCSWVHVSGSPVGSELGKMSWPQMLHAATPATMAANAKKGPR